MMMRHGTILLACVIGVTIGVWAVDGLGGGAGHRGPDSGIWIA